MTTYKMSQKAGHIYSNNQIAFLINRKIMRLSTATLRRGRDNLAGIATSYEVVGSGLEPL
jgi:hypothetical protein